MPSTRSRRLPLPPCPVNRVDESRAGEYRRGMSDYSSPSPEDEVEGAGDSAESTTSSNGTDDTKTSDNVEAGTGTDEDTVSGGAPEPPD